MKSGIVTNGNSGGFVTHYNVGSGKNLFFGFIIIVLEFVHFVMETFRTDCFTPVSTNFGNFR